MSAPPSIGSAHRRLLAVVGTTWALAAMEVILISFALPDPIEAWSLSDTAAGALGSASLDGMALGSWLGGWYAGLGGRVTALKWAVASYSTATGVTALATGVHTVFALRFVAGIGVGATSTAATTDLSEHLPADDRGRHMVYFDGFWAVGTIVAVAVAWAFLSPAAPPLGRTLGVTGWRLLFAFAAFPVLLVAVLVRLKETPYSLVATGRPKVARERIESTRKIRTRISPRCRANFRFTGPREGTAFVSTTASTRGTKSRRFTIRCSRSSS